MVADFLIPRLITIVVLLAVLLALTYYVVFRKKFNFRKFMLVLLAVNVVSPFFSHWEEGWLAAAINISLKLTLVIDFVLYLLVKYKKIKVKA